LSLKQYTRSFPLVGVVTDEGAVVDLGWLKTLMRIEARATHHRKSYYKTSCGVVTDEGAVVDLGMVEAPMNRSKGDSP
jgi:hypothetical protein